MRGNSNYAELYKREILSTVYFSVFSEEKLQKDIVGFIYKKSERKVNHEPVIEAIRELTKVGHIKATNPEALTHHKLYANSFPIMRHINEKAKERQSWSKSSNSKKEYKFTQKEEKIISSILDSSWFRSLFSEDKLQYYKDAGEGNGKSIVSNSPRKISEVLLNIATFNIGFSAAVDLCKEIPTVHEVNTTVNFDKFAQDWVSKYFSKYKVFIEKTAERSSKNLRGFIPPSYYQNLFFLCIPRKFATKLALILDFHPSVLTQTRNAMVELAESNEEYRKNLDQKTLDALSCYGF